MRLFRFAGKMSQFLGRNGFFKCTGFALYRADVPNETDFPGYATDTIRIYPVTSRGHDGRCMIEIPVAEVKQFTKELLKAALIKEV